MILVEQGYFWCSISINPLAYTGKVIKSNCINMYQASRKSSIFRCCSVSI